MENCQRIIRAWHRRPALLEIGIVCALSVVAIAFPLQARAQSASAVDSIAGDPNVTLDWSQGDWLHGSDPISGCVTFVGGTSTGPGDFSKVDSVECSPVPDGWDWNVTVTGQNTIYYSFRGIPPGYRVCGQVYGSARHARVIFNVDLVKNWLTCVDLVSGEQIWSGPYAGFDPGSHGFRRLAATRCGEVRLIQPVPTQTGSWGQIKSIYR